MFRALSSNPYMDGGNFQIYSVQITGKCKTFSFPLGMIWLLVLKCRTNSREICTKMFVPHEKLFLEKQPSTLSRGGRGGDTTLPPTMIWVFRMFGPARKTFCFRIITWKIGSQDIALENFLIKWNQTKLKETAHALSQLASKKA